ncbi:MULTISPECIES: PerC family transcriptional regulator [Hafnia]|uniref:PerC family transcriptional regulator n=1 Tax=Hafnia TaxID=568 RepID=UPI0005B8D016|nr:PerC family transcriptional regulator [Hafnia alvei]MCV9380298.1 PerC family transcriptional regulator [Hafnia alvei]MDX6847630.1 PerC family transcriptional regulator [Hafnia alvei]RLR05948.1 PerC family transcriptional regulator [Hafnia alvei ATCC 13337]TBM33946.1 PerC family transcriptional regulator [Hafnia alvei]WQD27682.1 PerC family transcriptional regulator [Hafnia alvei]
MPKRHPTKPTKATLFCFSTTAEKHHKLALSLETKGAWRRAARQWLDLFDCVSEDHEREYAAMRREKCLMAAEESTRLAQREANRKDSL